MYSIKVTERKNYSSLDIMKFIMAILILTQHTCNEWAHSIGLVHDFFGLGNFAVPFFFACSGFLFFKKCNSFNSYEQGQYYKKWSIRIGKIYLAWSAIYFVFVFHNWVCHNFDRNLILDDVHKALVYSTYSTIWFLPALWIGVSFCYWMKSRFSRRVLLLTMVMLMIIGNLFGSYSEVLSKVDFLDSINNWYTAVFVTWRNGIFNGAPYVFIGLAVAEGYGLSRTRFANAFLAFFFCAAFLCEAFIISRYHLGGLTDMGFMMAPAIYFMLLTLIQTNFAERKVWIRCRNLSILIFLSQRLFLSALPGVIPGMSDWIRSLTEPLIYLYFIIVVVTFSFLMEKLSKRYKILKILW